MYIQIEQMWGESIQGDHFRVLDDVGHVRPPYTYCSRNAGKAKLPW